MRNNKCINKVIARCRLFLFENCLLNAQLCTEHVFTALAAVHLHICARFGVSVSVAPMRKLRFRCCRCSTQTNDNNNYHQFFHLKLTIFAFFHHLIALRCERRVCRNLCKQTQTKDRQNNALAQRIDSQRFKTHFYFSRSICNRHNYHFEGYAHCERWASGMTRQRVEENCIDQIERKYSLWNVGCAMRCVILAKSNEQIMQSMHVKYYAFDECSTLT